MENEEGEYEVNTAETGFCSTWFLLVANVSAFLPLSRYIARPRAREGGWTDAGALTPRNLPSGYAPISASFRVVISLCSPALRDKYFVRWNGTERKVAHGSRLVIVYTSSSFRSERDPRVTFVSGVADALQIERTDWSRSSSHAWYSD